MPHQNPPGGNAGEIKHYDKVPAANTRVAIGTLAVVVVNDNPLLLLKTKGDWIDVMTGQHVHDTSTEPLPPLDLMDLG